MFTLALLMLITVTQCFKYLYGVLRNQFVRPISIIHAAIHNEVVSTANYATNLSPHIYVGKSRYSLA